MFGQWKSENWISEDTVASDDMSVMKVFMKITYFSYTVNAEYRHTQYVETVM
jgi:hypothetical protein